MREPFEEPVVGNKKEPQENSSQERNYLSDSKSPARAKLFAPQTEVREEICSATSFLRQLSQKKEVHPMF